MLNSPALHCILPSLSTIISQTVFLILKKVLLLCIQLSLLYNSWSLTSFSIFWFWYIFNMKWPFHFFLSSPVRYHAFSRDPENCFQFFPHIYLHGRGSQRKKTKEQWYQKTKEITIVIYGHFFRLQKNTDKNSFSFIWWYNVYVY